LTAGKLDAIYQGVANQYPTLDAIQRGMVDQAASSSTKLGAIYEAIANQYSKLDAIQDHLRSEGSIRRSVEELLTSLINQYSKLESNQAFLANELEKLLQLHQPRLESAHPEVVETPSKLPIPRFVARRKRLCPDGLAQQRIAAYFQQFFNAYRNQNYGEAV